MVSIAPDFMTKAADVIGLALRPVMWKYADPSRRVTSSSSFSAD